MFRVIYHHLVVTEDIPRFSSSWRKKARRVIEKKLVREPELFGKPLRRSLKGYRKLRVGDYRIVYRIDGDVIKIFVIQHRSVVYKTTEKRK